MKNLSLFKRIVIMNIIVMLLFMSMFIVQDYLTVREQIVTLENEKVSSIAKAAEPAITANLTLGLDDAYEETILEQLQLHQELVKITLRSDSGKLLHEAYQTGFKEEDLQKHHYPSLTRHLTDKIYKTPMGSITFHYTFSGLQKELIEDYRNFLFLMILLFALSMILLTLLVRHTFKPLKELTSRLASYSPHQKLAMETIEGSDEVAIINNAAKEMLTRIDQHTLTLEEKVTARTRDLEAANNTLTETQQHLQTLNLELGSRVEEEVQKRLAFEKELAHQSRLASMGEMIDNIAHQWRQPLMNLSAILMNIDRAHELDKLDSALLDEKTCEASSLIAHMSQTIEDFRNFFQPEKEMHEFYLYGAVQDALTLLSGTLEPICINVDLDHDPLVMGYRGELIQVMLSLLTNASEVFEQRNTVQPRIDIKVASTPEATHLMIEDNAGGIRPDIIARIFEPYFTTKHRAGGTGLGLYICKMLIEESMNGTLSVANGPHGAVFTITFHKEYACENS